MSRSPNILFIIWDQLTPFALKAYNEEAVTITPNINTLADKGVVFQNAYCNQPICVCSRASLMTGRYCSELASYDNGSELYQNINGRLEEHRQQRHSKQAASNEDQPLPTVNGQIKCQQDLKEQESTQ